ncbi:hypothetical protein HYV44_02240 [Candidatus Microgenomates bacterium]|nr:hypothetical protein [Candidatus Microgenomates bacterium]
MMFEGAPKFEKAKKLDDLTEQEWSKLDENERNALIYEKYQGALKAIGVEENELQLHRRAMACRELGRIFYNNNCSPKSTVAVELSNGERAFTWSQLISGKEAGQEKIDEIRDSVPDIFGNLNPEAEVYKKEPWKREMKKEEAYRLDVLFADLAVKKNAKDEKKEAA